MPYDKPHLLLSGIGNAIHYTSRLIPRSKIPVVDRIRESHGKLLLEQVSIIQAEADRLADLREKEGLNRQRGIVVEIEGHPGFPLKFESLDASGFKLLSTRIVNSIEYASVFIPDGRLAAFVKKIEEYLTKDSTSKKDPNQASPRHQRLIQNIERIRKATLESIWTDHHDLFPNHDNPMWWEVWLADRSDLGTEEDATFKFFQSKAARFNLTVQSPTLRFPERTVTLVFGRKSDLSESFEILNCISELRKPASTAYSIMRLGPVEQHEWASELEKRINVSDYVKNSICILDTGVNNDHLLLKQSVEDRDLLSVNQEWETADNHGHGTAMAGIALYGDLLPLLNSSLPVVLNHTVESVKILHETQQHKPELYGYVTGRAIYLIESQKPDRVRIFLLPVSAEESDGRPTSWSAMIDQITSGYYDDFRRLLILSAGNVETKTDKDYPSKNHESGIENPGQSFNALTVGACTEKVYLSPDEEMDYRSLAKAGTLSPTSRTSLPWKKDWAYKPDLVFEGGNLAYNNEGLISSSDSLSLLTLSNQPLKSQFFVTGMTSAAAAGVARIASIVQTSYPDFWPETVRGLLVHNAEWTEQMRKESADFGAQDLELFLLRKYGYGVPDLDRSCWSAENAANLIMQDELLPFEEKDRKIKTADLHLYRLPWPTQVLQSLGEEIVELRITLSYFIEPDPARRSFTSKFQYQSHGLRFALKRATEDELEFRGRINKEEHENGSISVTEDGSQWTFGPMQRTRGSLHHDRWKGPATDLAARNMLAIYPVGGWWRHKKKEFRYKRRTRYSLIVSIHTKEIDIYTPIANQVLIKV